MTIHVRHWGPGDEAAPEEETYQVTITGASIADFKLLIDRALNVWPDAPKDLKDMGDMFTHGRITQDHTFKRMNALQNTDLATPEEIEVAQKILAEVGIPKWREMLSSGEAWREIHARTKK